MPDLPPNETVILLAEDDPIVRNLINTLLTQERYAVLAANDGQEAWEIFEAYTDPIHLLLTDIEMPRMKGWDLLARVRAKRPDLKVIAMSGYTVDLIRAENRPDAFLKKPFIPPTLLSCIQRVLASPGAVDCEG